MNVAAAHQVRDLRIDFFRGLALLFIFIDHVPGNRLADVTLRNFGFSDAAEVFVLLAGFSAVLAYGKYFDRHTFADGALQVGRRVGAIYGWHLAVLGASVALLLGAASLTSDPKYISYVGLQSFTEAPARAVSEVLILLNQPNMLNILPLYIVLLAWFPIIFMLIRSSPAGAIAISGAIWIFANLVGLNLPTRQAPGWFFNPFAWQFLLTIGAVAAFYVRQAKSLEYRPLVWLAAGYVLLAFIVAAPWTRIPSFAGTELIPRSVFGHMDKTYLSVWRLAHVLAMGYLALVLIPKQTDWLKSRFAAFVSLCGRHSLEVFSVGTFLSFLGWITFDIAGHGFTAHVLVNGVGIGLLGLTAWYAAQRKQRHDIIFARSDSDTRAIENTLASPGLLRLSVR